MSKAYLLVICLFFASLSGCITDDELEDKSPSIQDDDMIEPVGTGNNETDDYDELIAEIQNLTNEIAKLRLEIEINRAELEKLGAGYDVPENSTIKIQTVNSFQDVDTGDWYLEYKPQYNITKNGNTVTVEFVGSFTATPQNETTGDWTCTSGGPYIIRFENVDGVAIASYYGGAYNWLARGLEVTSECEWEEEDNWDRTEYWTTVTFILPEEPVRFHWNTWDGESYTFE
ncbi:MAG: hypothetical protein QF535_21415 [Anaerolineales bacterium]|nr:hypothetical protein [Anaerolineales bacterium]